MMQPKMYHVHVYRIAEMQEVNVVAQTPEEAQTVALESVELYCQDRWRSPDNEKISLAFEAKETT